MRIQHALIALTCLIGIPCFAQSNQRMDDLLVQVQARTDAVCYLVLTAGGQVPESSDPSTAYSMAFDNQWLPAGSSAEAPVTLDVFCNLVMKSFSLEGGLMYRIFPGPRYAYRNFVSLGLVNPNGGPRRTVPGDEVLLVVSRAMEIKGGSQ